MAKTRTFVAIAASEENRTRVVALANQLKQTAPGVKWVQRANLHWTLQFLGDVNDNLLPAVCSAVAKSAQNSEPFALEARGASAFPNIEKPRTIWLGAGQGGEEVIQIQGAVEEALTELGFSGETRRYVPHLTLGRAARSLRLTQLGREMLAHADYDGGTFFVDELLIYGSQPGPNGPIYHIVGRAPLGA